MSRHLMIRVVLFTALVLFARAAAAAPVTINLAWDPSPSPGVVGYVVRVGTAAGVYTDEIDVGNALTYAFAGDSTVKYYFAVVAYDGNNQWSGPSNEVNTLAAPVITDPGNQSDRAGVALTRQLTATDADGPPLTFSAVALPAGLIIGPSTGLISGTPTTPGTYAVTATVTDSTARSDSASFTWTITPPIPATPTTQAPAGDVSSATPTFQWSASTHATSYVLRSTDGAGVQRQATLTAAAVCSGATCSTTPAPHSAGPASWSVQAVNVSGSSAFSADRSFTVRIDDNDVPVPANRLPTGGSHAIRTAPVYSWQPVANSIWYYLRITNSAGVQQFQWVAPSACSEQTGRCTYTGTTLPAGPSHWEIQATRVSGFSPWSAQNDFEAITTDATAPTVTVLNPGSAQHTSTANMVTISGAAADNVGVTQVTLRNDRDGVTLTASGTTSWSRAVTLLEGANVFTVTARDAANLTGIATVTITYVTAPAAPTPVSPSGTLATSTPSFTWSAVASATSYTLWVDDSAQAGKISRVYTAAAAGCASGTGTCSVSPGVALAPGAAAWWIRASNASGTGPWSGSLSMVVPNIVPPAPVPVAPTGTVSTPSPTFTWSAVATATSYTISVDDASGAAPFTRTYTAAAADCGDGTGACRATPGVMLEVGAGQWTVRAANSVGSGPWSAALAFTMAATAPDAATQIAPTGLLATGTPTFSWNAVGNATSYTLWVDDSGQPGKIVRTYSAAAAGCAAGTGVCSVTPGVGLTAGAGQWWVRTANEVGNGPWSSGLTFTAPASPPPAATLVSPSGVLPNATPAFVWNAVATATSYVLWVDDAQQAGKITLTVSAAAVGCAAGTGTCTLSPGVALAAGTATWWVRTANAEGAGPWSASLAMTVPAGGVTTPPPADLISPSGVLGSSTPTFTWNAVPQATSYTLWVDDAGQAGRIVRTYTAAAAGCGSGSGVCSVSPGVALAPGAGAWWVRTANSAGSGPWSGALAFTAP